MCLLINNWSLIVKKKMSRFLDLINGKSTPVAPISVKNEVVVEKLVVVEQPKIEIKKPIQPIASPNKKWIEGQF